MARIRSFHPGQATDEDYMELSLRARLLALHIRCEADDHGVFPWKPIILKARIFPADSISLTKMEKLLAELATHNQIMAYEVGGKKYGVIRNFGRWQRPQKPSYTHPVVHDALIYAGFNPKDQYDTGHVPVQDQYDTGTGIHQQIGKGEKKEEENKHQLTPPIAPPAGWQEREDVQFGSIPMDGKKQEQSLPARPAPVKPSADGIAPAKSGRPAELADDEPANSAAPDRLASKADPQMSYLLGLIKTNRYLQHADSAAPAEPVGPSVQPTPGRSPVESTGYAPEGSSAPGGHLSTEPTEPTSSASSVSPPETLPALLDLTPTTADPVQQAFSRYNHAAETAGLPVAQAITPERRAKIKARLKECGGLDGWDAALEKLAASALCTGAKTGWKADLDFILKKSKFLKLMEGSYDDHRTSSAAENSWFAAGCRVIDRLNRHGLLDPADSYS